MKIVFVSNYFNHHQKPFCEEMYRRFGDDFFFISTGVMREERKKLGYSQDDRPPYVLLSYESDEQRRKAVSLINSANAVIAGDAPNDMFSARIRAGKIVFRYTERPYKMKVSPIKKIYHFFLWRKKDFWKRRVYLLCAGAYTASDYASLGMYKNRTYQWGYFPAVHEYGEEALLSRKKSNTLIWCGRFIDWKHPEAAIDVAERLKRDGYDFRLNMIGTGAMEDALKRRVETQGLGDNVRFLGAMPPERVREHMEEAGVYLFTSDRQEGWGAVLNESMNSGCAVVASHAIGSVPYLLNDRENGFVYFSGNTESLYEKVKYLLDHPNEQKRLGINAYRTIVAEWNAHIAAERFLHLAKRILSGEKYPAPYQTGPCTRADILKDN